MASCIKWLLYITSYIISINSQQIFTNPKSDITCVQSDYDCLITCDGTQSCNGITFYLDANSTVDIDCIGINSCNSLNIFSIGAVQSLKLTVFKQAFKNSKININLDKTSSNNLIQCSGNNSCHNSIFNIYSKISNHGTFQIDCASDSCSNMMINTETIHKLILNGPCNGCNIYSPVFGAVQISECLNNDTNIYSLQGVKTVTYSDDLYCKSNNTFNLFCGLKYENLCQLYKDTDHTNDGFKCFNNDTDHNDDENLCVINIGHNIYNSTQSSLHFPLINDIINCDHHKDCYIYGQSSSDNTNITNDGINIICPENKKCSLVHCGDDCENMKITANNTNILDIINCENCKNSKIMANECDNVNIYWYMSFNLGNNGNGAFTNAMIKTDTTDTLYIDGNYNFDNLSIISSDTMIDIDCIKSCKYISILTDNATNVDIICYDGNNRDLCNGFIVYLDDTYYKRGCKMEIINSSWSCVKFNNSLTTTTTANNDNNSDDKDKWKWIAIDSSISIVSLIIIVAVVIFFIYYCRRRRQKKLTDNYVMLQETAKYYQD